MSKELTVTEWGRLPFWVRARIEEMGATNKEQWILRKRPADPIARRGTPGNALGGGVA